MEGLGYGEVDADDAKRIRRLERDVTELRIELEVLKAQHTQQQPSTVHHHYHGGQQPQYRDGEAWCGNTGGATA